MWFLVCTEFSLYLIFDMQFETTLSANATRECERVSCILDKFIEDNSDINSDRYPTKDFHEKHI